jgi:hypothetical protein
MNQDFFRQTLKYTNKPNRIEYFADLIQNKKAIHYGCADWPIFNISNNLHYKLLSTNPTLIGYDIDKPTIEQMKGLKEFDNKTLVSELTEIKEKLDIVIAPETIEHVFNVENFILELSKIGQEVLITAPNALCHDHYYRNTDEYPLFTEIVHPDHKYWFSLYTLMNCIKSILLKHKIEHEIKEIGFLENKTMVFCLYSIKEEKK